MPDDVLALAEQFRRALVANDVAAEKRLIAAYQGLYARVRDLADALVLEIAKDETLTPAQVRRLERYGRLLKTVEGELTDYQAFAKTEMSIAAREAIRMGEANARALVAIAFGDKQLAARFNVLNTAVIEQLLGFLSPEGELYKRLALLPKFTADQVANAILEGVGLGKNPKTIARGLTDAFGMGLTDSMRMMRTVQIYSYREANLASYRANSDVVSKWIWYANLATACPSCIAMHGTVHDLSERLNDHHNGHCAPLPLVIGAKNDITAGADWFAQQPEAYQRQTLGKSKFEAWKGGAFQFGDLVTTHNDAVYGEMRTTAPLWQLLGAEPPVRMGR